MISEQQSIAIFNEIKNNNNLDANNNFINFSDALSLDIIANPQKYPVIVNLTNAQKAHLANQIDVTNAKHNKKTDFNGYPLKRNDLTNTLDANRSKETFTYEEF